MIRIVCLAALLCLPSITQAVSLNELRDSEVASALRQALEVGVTNAVTKIGQENGFLDNQKIRIPLPESMQKAEKAMRKIGLGSQADELITTMNRAAEQAVPETRALLGNTVRKMSIADAKKILTGPDDAATQYFKQVNEQQLIERIAPIVSKNTKRLKLADYYNRFASKGVAFGLIRPEDADLDKYVTAKTLDGLFTTLAEEEKAIRANPVDTGKKLINKVFGSIIR